MKNIPFVTVVIPTYRRCKCLQAALKSVQEQKGFADYEIIVMDNDSTPDSDVQKMVAALAEPRLSYYKNSRNLGQIGNWNTGIALARSEWVVLLHDDDALLPDYFHTVVSCLINNPDIDGLFTMPVTIKCGEAGIKEDCIKSIYKRMRTCYKDKYIGTLTRLKPWDYYVDCGYNAPLAPIYRRQAVLEMGGFDEGWFPVSDMAFHAEFCKRYTLCVLSVFGCIRGLGVNHSLEKDVTLGFVRKGTELRHKLGLQLDTVLGEWWIQAGGWHHGRAYHHLSSEELCSFLDTRYKGMLFQAAYRALVLLFGFSKRYYLQIEKLIIESEFQKFISKRSEQ